MYGNIPTIGYVIVAPVGSSTAKPQHVVLYLIVKSSFLTVKLGYNYAQHQYNNFSGNKKPVICQHCLSFSFEFFK